jgi:hypothetical protein
MAAKHMRGVRECEFAGSPDRSGSHVEGAIESGTAGQPAADASLNKPVTTGPRPAAETAKYDEFGKWSVRSLNSRRYTHRIVSIRALSEYLGLIWTLHP